MAVSWETPLFSAPRYRPTLASIGLRRPRYRPGARESSHLQMLPGGIGQGRGNSPKWANGGEFVLGGIGQVSVHTWNLTGRGHVRNEVVREG